jgi:RNA polymerase sigma factor (sigma-70 family)
MDESALVAVYERYQQRLYRFCFAILGNAEDAQDALQNTMVKALRALRGEQRQIELKPWLYRIAHNESIDLLRRRRNEAQIDPELPVSTSDPQEAAATRERLRHLLTDLASLPERQRETLIMRELAGLSFAEIGEAFETSPDVARQTLYEARLNLRQLETGREMSCAEVMRQISDGDGRVLRRRGTQAHLRACAECREFREAIEGRQRDLAAIAPLPAAAAASALQGLLAGTAGGGAATTGAAGAGAGAAGTVGAGAGKVVATSVVVKSVATVAVVAVVGVGAADRGGLIDAGLPGGDSSQPVESGRDRLPAAGEPAVTEELKQRPERASSSQPASAKQTEESTTENPAPGQTPATPADAEQPAPSADSDPSSLPAAAKHGQEVAASHGGGRGHGQSQGQAKGKAKQKSASGNGSPPSPAEHDPKPASIKPPQAKAKQGKAQPGQVGPDVSPQPPLKPSQPPKSQGATGAAGSPSSKEAR